MMNAEVTAENRPDSPTHQPYWFCERDETHKNEGGVQIFIVLLLKVIVVFSDFLLESFIETGPGVGATVLLQHRLQDVTQSILEAFGSQQVSTVIIAIRWRDYRSGWFKLSSGVGYTIFEVGWKCGGFLQPRLIRGTALGMGRRAHL